MRSALNAMIKSKRFKAVLKARRQFLLREAPERAVYRDEAVSKQQNIGWVEAYIARYAPHRLELLERRMYLLNLYEPKKYVTQPAISERYTQMTLMSTIWYVIKALELYPNTRFALDVNVSRRPTKSEHSLFCTEETYRSPLLQNCKSNGEIRFLTMTTQEDECRHYKEIRAMATPEFFKVVYGPPKLRKFESVFHWIYCMKFSTTNYPFRSREDLLKMAEGTRLTLAYNYLEDPIKFNLVSQCARLLMP